MPKPPKKNEITTRPKEIIALEKCRNELAAMTSLESVLNLRDKAVAIKSYLKARGDARASQNSAARIAALSEARAGQLIKEGQKSGEIRQQGKKDESKMEQTYQLGRSDNDKKDDGSKKLEDIGISWNQSSRFQLASEVLDSDPEWFDRHQIECDEKGWDFTQQSVLRQAKQIRNEQIGKIEPSPIKGKYDVIVIDPPWQIEKIEREVRGNSTAFDYPTMTELELESLTLPVAKNCHVWIWTTQRFLPMAFRLVPKWNLRYVCLFVWHKNGGMQPVKLPQYNCEFVLYCRHGVPKFSSTKKFKLCNRWDRKGHSEKPKEFYEMVERVTTGKRLDMFSRREIKGFETWGNEAPTTSQNK